jgi:hypothetical protein
VERIVAWYRLGSSIGAVVALVVANLIPLIGVLFFGWSVWNILVIYWLENGIVGVINVLKMSVATGDEVTPGVTLMVNGRPATSATKVGLIPFFIVHYGIFWFVHGIFVFALPLFVGGGGSFDGCGMPDPQFTVDACAGPLGQVVWGNVAIAGVALFLSHGASFLFNYIGNAEYLTASPARQMGAAYGRVVVLHLTILLGAFAVAFLGAPIAALLVLVVLKTALDLGLHRREHRAAAERVPADTTFGRIVRGA